MTSLIWKGLIQVRATSFILTKALHGPKHVGSHNKEESIKTHSPTGPSSWVRVVLSASVSFILLYLYAVQLSAVATEPFFNSHCHMWAYNMYRTPLQVLVYDSSPYHLFILFNSQPYILIIYYIKVSFYRETFVDYLGGLLYLKPKD